MNYLAHTLLSKKDIDYQIANLISDTIKSRPWDGCSPAHREGLVMHKVIDRFTDENAHVYRAKQELGSGYLRGVVTDILFDHFITKHWDTFVIIDFEIFIRNFYRQAREHSINLPNDAKTFVDKVITYDFFHLYRDITTLEKVFRKFDLRLSKRMLARESTSEYLVRISDNYLVLEECFLQFFPELIQCIVNKGKFSSHQHYFIQ